MLNSKKSNIKVYILDDFIYMKFKSRQKPIKVLEVRVAFILGGLVTGRERRCYLGAGKNLFFMWVLLIWYVQLLNIYHAITF